MKCQEKNYSPNKPLPSDGVGGGGVVYEAI